MRSKWWPLRSGEVHTYLGDCDNTKRSATHCKQQAWRMNECHLREVDLIVDSFGQFIRWYLYTVKSIDICAAEAPRCDDRVPDSAEGARTHVAQDLRFFSQISSDYFEQWFGHQISNWFRHGRTCYQMNWLLLSSWVDTARCSRGNQKSRVLLRLKKDWSGHFLRHFSQSFPLMSERTLILPVSPRPALAAFTSHAAGRWFKDGGLAKLGASRRRKCHGRIFKVCDWRWSFWRSLRFQGSKCYDWVANVSFLEMMLLQVTWEASWQSVLRLRVLVLQNS